VFRPSAAPLRPWQEHSELSERRRAALSSAVAAQAAAGILEATYLQSGALLGVAFVLGLATAGVAKARPRIFVAMAAVQVVAWCAVYLAGGGRAAREQELGRTILADAERYRDQHGTFPRRADEMYSRDEVRIRTCLGAGICVRYVRGVDDACVFRHGWLRPIVLRECVPRPPP